MKLIGASDCGGTWTNTAVFNFEGEMIHHDTFATEKDYAFNNWRIAASFEDMQNRSGEGDEIVSATIAVAAKVDEGGYLVQAGELSPWIGNRLGEDVAEALGWNDQSRVNTIGDMVAAAISQHAINVANEEPVDGYATTLSSGWGGAAYHADGTIVSDGPGHEYLRDGGVCTCGQPGHAEAFITGKGIQKNHGIPSEEWLSRCPNGGQFVRDLSDAVIAMVERHSKAGFEPAEIRWTGSVALGQPMFINYAEDRAVRLASRRGIVMPTWSLLEKGKQAGLHGAFIDAHRLALAA